MPKTLAIMILRAAKLHEDSYIPGEDKHTLSIREASMEAAKGYGCAEFGEIVYYLLKYVWNDALDWARSIMA